ncbi:hypothetical protein SDC9_95548 [bioreactor metagenome]|uniref:Uncharacterized protein n=1 Tax=bioreactor metagenome TaxID=1076179 RepID=A0A645A967_9ZZZZ
MRLALGQLGLDFRDHVIGHHRTQRRDVSAVPRGLQRHEVALGSREEAFGVETLRHTPVLRTGQGRADHRATCGCRSTRGSGRERHVALVERTGRCVVAHLVGVVLARCFSLCGAGVACTLEGERRRVGLLRRGTAAARSHDHADDEERRECQQGNHQHVGKAFAHAERMCKPRQTKACRQTAKHGAPGLLGCRSSQVRSAGLACGCGGSGVLRGCTRRGSGATCFALRHVGRLLAHRLATAHAARVGVEVHHQCHHGHQNYRPQFHRVISIELTTCPFHYRGSALDSNM